MEELNWDEIIKIKAKIKTAAFNQNNEMIRFEMPDIPFNDETTYQKNLDLFITKYAIILYLHEESKKPTAKKELKGHKEVILQEYEEKLLKDGFNKKTIKAVRNLLSSELDQQIKKFPNTPDGKYFIYPKTKPESHFWVIREDETIHKLRNLYQKHTPLQEDRHIKYNMALVFDAIDFWPHERKGSNRDRIDRYHDRIHKRIEKIKKDPLYKNDFLKIP